MIPSYIVSAKGSKDQTKGNEDFGIAYTATSPALFVVADGYWGSGRAASVLVPHLFYRNLRDLIASEQLSPENCTVLLQECVKRTNVELRNAVPNGFTTFTAALVDEHNAYVFTLGDSVAFGYRTTGGLELLTEPDTDTYENVKNFHRSNKPFDSYCVIDRGKKGPKNFFGLPSHQFSVETHPAPHIKNVQVVPRTELSYLLLCTDGLTSRVLQEELETLCRTVDSEELLSAIMKRWNEPEEMILYLLHELKEKAPVQEVLTQYNFTPESDSKKIYDAIRADPKGFAALREACLNYDDGQGIRKPVDDTEVMLVDLRPIERRSVLSLSQEIIRLGQESSAAASMYEKRIASLTERVTSVEKESKTLANRLTEKEARIREYSVEIGQYQEKETRLIQTVKTEKARADKAATAAEQARVSREAEVTALTQRVEELQVQVQSLEIRPETYSSHEPEQTTTTTPGCFSKIVQYSAAGAAIVLGALVLQCTGIIYSKLYSHNQPEILAQNEVMPEITPPKEEPREPVSSPNNCPPPKPVQDPLPETTGLLSLCITPDNRFAFFNESDSQAYALLATENTPDYTQRVQCVLPFTFHRKDTGVLLYYADPLLTLFYNDPYRFVLNEKADPVSINTILQNDIPSISHCDYSKLTRVHGVKTCTTEKFKFTNRTQTDKGGYIFKNVPIGERDEIIISTQTTE